MQQQRVTKPRRATGRRRTGREDEPQEERKEVREDLRHWFEDQS